MCVIIELEKGKEFPFNNLENAVRNNPDGFGLMMYRDNAVEVQRYLPEKPDADTVAKILEKFKDEHRVLHLRYKTKGSVSKENLHPFPVIVDKKNQVYMMHNGTFHEMNKFIQDEESDSKAFAREVLNPILSRMKFKDNIVDLNDPVVKLILEQFVTAHNKVFLINKNSSLKLGSWSEFQGFPVSNTSYFSYVQTNRTGASYGTSSYGRFQHGQNTSWSQQKTETTVDKEESTKEVKDSSLIDFNSTSTTVNSLSYIETLMRRGKETVKSIMGTLLPNTDVSLTRDDMIKISCLETEEIESALKDAAKTGDFLCIAYLISALASEVEECDIEIQTINEKKRKAELKIEELSKQKSTEVVCLPAVVGG